MGCSESGIDQDHQPKRQQKSGNSSSKKRTKKGQNYIPEEEEEVEDEEEEDEFKDFEELGNGKTIGEGIKKIPSYKCSIPYDKLNHLREKFWNSKEDNPRIWQVIRECCETDAETAKMLLEAAEMMCVDKDLRRVINVNDPSEVYKVPNFCVCDPCFERDYDSLKKKFNNSEQVKMKIIIYYPAQNKTVKLHVTNKTHVKKIKEAFAKKLDIDLNTHKIRLLFRGQELADQNLLCYNNVEDMSKIQAMVNEI